MFCVVTSPPFFGILPHEGGDSVAWKFHGDQGEYGRTPGQLGAMKEGTMTMTDVAIPKETWRGCYDQGWQEGEITAESFSHPAKMAKGLVYRIVKEGLLRGWWKRKDIICDPFGGIGSTGLACSAFGIQSVLVELEAKFVALANENFRLHAKAWDALSLPHPIILQGDSRELASIVRASGCVTSPPWAESIQGSDGNSFAKKADDVRSNPRYPGEKLYTHRTGDSYGSTPGQIGAMKEGPFGVVTSPPYADSLKPETEEQTKKKQARIAKSKSLYDGRKLEEPSPGKASMGGGYSAITSPPYANRVDDSGTGPVAAKNGKYGESDGQMGNLRIAAVTSPPYESSSVHGVDGNTERLLGGPKAPGLHGGGKVVYDNPVSEGQIGQESQETYWQAVQLVYEQIFQLFSPGGHAAVVVKSFVRNKRIVPLPEMTLALLEKIGFEPVLYVDAMLVGDTQASMFKEVPDYTKERKSFFRRIHEKKHPETKINSEVVLVVRKP